MLIFCVIVLESPLKNVAGYPLCLSSRARTGSGWRNRPAGRNASKPSSAATATNRTGMIPTPSARRSPACRAFTIAADSSTACPAERWCFIRTKYTMARRAPRRGFHYRMVYIEPALIQKILGGRPLPFIPGGLSADPRLRCAALPLLKAVTDTFEPLEEEDAPVRPGADPGRCRRPTFPSPGV